MKINIANLKVIKSYNRITLNLKKIGLHTVTLNTLKLTLMIIFIYLTTL